MEKVCVSSLPALIYHNRSNGYPEVTVLIKTPIGLYHCTPRGQRVKSLLVQCYLPGNETCLNMLPVWFNASKKYADKNTKTEREEISYRVLYILNHLCPQLQHQFQISDKYKGMEYLGLANACELETTQETKWYGGISIQDGVHYTKYELNEIEKFVSNIEKNKWFFRKYESAKLKATKDLKPFSMMLCIGLDRTDPKLSKNGLRYKLSNNTIFVSANNLLWIDLVKEGLAESEPADYWPNNAPCGDFSMHDCIYDGYAYYFEPNKSANYMNCHLSDLGLRYLEDKLSIEIVR